MLVGFGMRLLKSNHKKNRRNLLKMQGKNTYTVKTSKDRTREELMENIV